MLKWEQPTDRGFQSAAKVPLSKSPNAQTLRAPFHVTDRDASSVMNVAVACSSTEQLSVLNMMYLGIYSDPFGRFRLTASSSRAERRPQARWGFLEATYSHILFLIRNSFCRDPFFPRARTNVSSQKWRLHTLELLPAADTLTSLLNLPFSSRFFNYDTFNFITFESENRERDGPL